MKAVVASFLGWTSHTQARPIGSNKWLPFVRGPWRHRDQLVTGFSNPGPLI